jgi:phosphate transport system permease protein
LAAPISPPSGIAWSTGRLAIPDRAYRVILGSIAALFIAVLLAFIAAMAVQAVPAFSKLGFSFLYGTNWDPFHNHFGILPFVAGTLETTAIAMVLAVPVGLGAALALAYLAPRRLRTPLSTGVELLAAVPSVVFGLWGLLVVAPLFRSHVEPFLTSIFGWTGLFNGPNQGVGLLLAGVILFVMVLPTMVAISRDVLAAVPHDQVEGALALGATRWQVLRKVVVPGARVGLLGASTLAMGRAMGETVAMTLVIGNSTHLANSIKANAQTMPSVIVNSFGEATGTQLNVLFAIALLLLVVGIGVNAGARLLVRSIGVRGRISAVVP